MYQSIIADYRSSQSFLKLNKFLHQLIQNHLSENGTFWILCKNSFEKKEMIFNAFEISEHFHKYYLKNIILFHSDSPKKKNLFFGENFDQILFFAKNENFFLDKDPIREKHIWKDVEWGQRSKNYNKNGKDPGNFWMKTKDDGKANITKHIPLDSKESIKRIIKCSANEKQNICLINNKIAESFNRNIVHESI